MTRRLGPRPLAVALGELVGASAPATLLAELQGVWRDVAGAVVAAEAEPVSERDGIVTVRCSSAVWAHELELLGPDLLERLRAALSDGASLRELRFTAGGRGRRA